MVGVRYLVRVSAAVMVTVGALVSTASSASAVVRAPWSIVATPDTSAPGNQLASVSCVAKSDCWSVGNTYGGPSADSPWNTLAEHWDGRVWSIVSTPNAPSFRINMLESVSCVAGTDCWAVGQSVGATSATLAEHWDGRAWSIVSVRDPGSFANSLRAVTCVNRTDCWAVGSLVNTDLQGKNLAEHWDGRTWSVVPVPNVATTNDPREFDALLGMTCVSHADCWAVGQSVVGTIGAALAEHWDGRAWTIVATTDANEFLAVTCVRTSDCWAVGTAGADQTRAEHWNGHAWSAVATPNPAANQELWAVTCVRTSNCWAVGFSTSARTTLAEHWDGRIWSFVPTPNLSATDANRLVGVTCDPKNTPRRHEHARDDRKRARHDCWAVGATLDPSRETPLRTLAEHFGRI